MICRGEKFDGDLAGEMEVFREIDHAHTAFAQLFDNSIMGNRLTNHGDGSGLRVFTLPALCAKGTLNSRCWKKSNRPYRSYRTYKTYRVVSLIFFSCAARNSCSFSRNSERLFAKIATAKSAALIAPGFPIASVPTGIPPGICTVASSESRPFSASLRIGTPNTGKVV